jgi:2-polyprenyl-3-methyl-5-hydroxy-6-metoxy-1,4-benzoquinol methylase
VEAIAAIAQEDNAMSQEPVWEYFQNEGKDVFSGAYRRLEYLSKRVFAEERALNIGVGNGLLEEMLTAKGINVSVLDPDEGAIKRLREKLSLRDRAQNGYARAIPFVADSFDVVIISEVLEHLDERELVDSLGEVQRVLRPGG